MSLSGTILRLFGWKVVCSVPDYPKCIICVAPHTSNWDFILGKLAYWSLGRQAGFLIKQEWFFFPMNLIFKAFGGIPVKRRQRLVTHRHTDQKILGNRADVNSHNP